MNLSTFKKTNMKSPTGGLFKLFLDISNNIIYKKLMKKTDIKNIVHYTAILNTIGNVPILCKYILEPHNIRIEPDGSYYSTFIPNGIRLYDIQINTAMDKTIGSKIIQLVLELKYDLNNFSKTYKLLGDWALHNLIYCLDRNKIYNVDLEGFYTYPFVHNNGNCNIIDCNNRFDKLLDVIKKLLK